MAEEYFDVLDEEGKPTGVVRRRKSCHSLGLPHRVAHMWLMNWKREILVQKRSMLKDSFPGVWDISSAGHVDAGENVDDAAVRELTEELGVTELLEHTTIDFLFDMHIHCVKGDGKFIDNEFARVYGVWVDEDAMEHHLHFRLQETEVDEVRWVPVKELRERYLAHDPNYVCTLEPEKINFIFDNFDRYMDKKLQEQSQ